MPIQDAPLFLVCKLKTEVKNHGSKKANHKRQSEANRSDGNEKAQYKIPFITARIDRIASDANSKIKANASVTIGNHFAVHGIKVYDGGEKGLQVLYPGHKGTDGKFYDDFHPITKESRETLNGYVLDAYEQKMEQVQAEQQPESEELDEDEEPAFEQSM